VLLKRWGDMCDMDLNDNVTSDWWCGVGDKENTFKNIYLPFI
jgi:hypothetical protein